MYIVENGSYSCLEYHVFVLIPMLIYMTFLLPERKSYTTSLKTLYRRKSLPMSGLKISSKTSWKNSFDSPPSSTPCSPSNSINSCFFKSDGFSVEIISNCNTGLWSKAAGRGSIPCTCNTYILYRNSLVQGRRR